MAPNTIAPTIHTRKQSQKNCSITNRKEVTTRVERITLMFFVTEAFIRKAQMMRLIQFGSQKYRLQIAAPEVSEIPAFIAQVGSQLAKPISCIGNNSMMRPINSQDFRLMVFQGCLFYVLYCTEGSGCQRSRGMAIDVKTAITLQVCNQNHIAIRGARVAPAPKTVPSTITQNYGRLSLKSLMVTLKERMLAWMKHTPDMKSMLARLRLLMLRLHMKREMDMTVKQTRQRF